MIDTYFLSEFEKKALKTKYGESIVSFIDDKNSGGTYIQVNNKNTDLLNGSVSSVTVSSNLNDISCPIERIIVHIEFIINREWGN